MCWVKNIQVLEKVGKNKWNDKEQNGINYPENTLYKIFKRKRKICKNIKSHNVKRYLINQ